MRRFVRSSDVFKAIAWLSPGTARIVNSVLLRWRAWQESGLAASLHEATMEKLRFSSFPTLQDDCCQHRGLRSACLQGWLPFIVQPCVVGKEGGKRPLGLIQSPIKFPD